MREPRDLTQDAVRRQLRAMGCDLLDVALIHEAEGPGGRIIWQRGLTPAAVMHRKGYYAALNAQGFGVFVQPARGTDRALVLVDDLEDPDELTARDVTPCCVLETSQASFQCWIDLGPEPMPSEQRTAVARLLAREFDGDPGAAGHLHLGRLAGFQNRKPKHADATGRGPWVLARCSKPGACQRAVAIREWAARNARTALFRAETPDGDLAHTQTPKRAPEGKPGAAEAYAAALARYSAHAATRGHVDLSKADFAACCTCLRQGFAPADIRTALELTAVRKRDPADYARRTVAEALLEEPFQNGYRNKASHRENAPEGPFERRNT